MEKHCTQLAQRNVSAERRGRNNQKLLWSHRVIFILTGNTDPTAAWDSRRYREEEGRWQETSSSCQSAKRGESQNRLILPPYFLPRSHREKPLDNRPPPAYFFFLHERVGNPLMFFTVQSNLAVQMWSGGKKPNKYFPKEAKDRKPPPSLPTPAVTLMRLNETQQQRLSCQPQHTHSVKVQLCASTVHEKKKKKKAGALEWADADQHLSSPALTSRPSPSSPRLSERLPTSGSCWVTSVTDRLFPACEVYVSIRRLLGLI